DADARRRRAPGRDAERGRPARAQRSERARARVPRRRRDRGGRPGPRRGLGRRARRPRGAAPRALLPHARPPRPRRRLPDAPAPAEERDVSLAQLLFTEPGTLADATGRIYGVVVGLVSDNQDPRSLGRVKVKLPWLADDAESDWARIAVP